MTVTTVIVVISSQFQRVGGKLTVTMTAKTVIGMGGTVIAET